MNIAYLAWGSLVWDPRELPILRYWFDDGPFAPVEFTRQSSDGRITLVLDEEAHPVRLLWAQSTLLDPESAKRALKDREQITGVEWRTRIGSWGAGAAAPDYMPSLPAWAAAREVEFVVWTALEPQYKKTGEAKYSTERPSIEWVLEYLRSLTGPSRDVAERYFRRAPRQVDTVYRRCVEATLGWGYLRC